MTNQTVTIIEPTMPTDISDSILEVEGIQVHEPRIKPQPISVLSRPLSAVTTIQVDIIEVTVDGEPPPVIVSDPRNVPSYIPVPVPIPESRLGCCYVNKDCAICIGSVICVAAMIFSGIR